MHTPDYLNGDPLLLGLPSGGTDFAFLAASIATFHFTNQHHKPPWLILIQYW
jgi:hypothetical protein